jgi:hypothetical protein
MDDSILMPEMDKAMLNDLIEYLEENGEWT